MTAFDETTTNICYSLPRFITMGLQCSFCTYFWEMYTGEFGWTHPQYGKVSSIYSLTQIFSFVIFGLIFVFVIDNPRDKNKKVEDKLNYSKYILMGGTLVHSGTYFLLIILPIGWYGVDLTGIAFINRGLAKFWNGFCMPFRIIFSVIFLPIRLLLVLPLEILCKAICKGLTKCWSFFPNPLKIFFIALSFPLILIWKILYILLLPFGIFWTRFNLPLSTFKNVFGSGRISGRKYLTPYEVTKIEDAERERKRWLLLDSSVRMGPTATELMDSVPDPPPDLDLLQQIWASMPPEPGPTRASIWYCNLCKFITSKRLIVYLLTLIHGIGVSAHELSNKAIESYIYTDFLKMIGAINTNLSFFFISNIIIILIFSLVKLNATSRSKFSETFLMVAIVFGLLQIPALFGFYKWTKKDTSGGGDGSTNQCASTPNSTISWEKWAYLWIKWLCLTIWHSTVVFLIFSCGPLIVYVSIFILGGKSSIGIWGVLVFLGSLNCTSWLNMVLGKFGGGIGTDTVQMLLMGVCIMGQSAVYFLFANCNYLMLIFTGIVNSVFVTYANIMLGMMVGGNPMKWIFCGGFYSGTNLAVSWAMPTMFNAFGKDETRNVALKCIRFEYQYCFPTVYKAIAVFFQVLSLLSYYVYFMVHNYQNQLDAAENAKADKVTQLKTLACEFKGLAKEVVETANAFQTAAGTPKGFLQKATTFGKESGYEKFQAAASAYGEGAECADTSAAYKLKVFAKALVNAALQFKKFGESLAAASEGSCDLLRKNAHAFVGAVEQFKNETNAFAGAAGNDGFLNKAQKFKEEAEKIPDITIDAIKQSNVQKAIQQFKLASRKFGGTGEAAVKFHAFALELQKIQANLTCEKLKALAGKFTNAATQFQAKAEEFKTKASQFAYLAETFNDDPTTDKFVAAAQRFKETADHFQQLAITLADNLTGTELEQQADAFKQKAELFHTAAEQFQGLAQAVNTGEGDQYTADLNTIKQQFKDAADKFSKAAEQFGSESENKVAKLFNDFKSALEAASGDCQQLTGKTEAFTSAAGLFQAKAGPFKTEVDGIPDITVDVTKVTYEYKQVGGSKQTVSGRTETVKALKYSSVQKAIRAFRRVSSHNFMEAVWKFTELAIALENIMTNPTCNDITALATKFAKAEDSFQTWANAFQKWAKRFQTEASKFNGDTKKFRAAALYFMYVAERFKILANGLAKDLANTQLETQANDFKNKATLFHTEAQAFEKLAQQVNEQDKDDLQQIQATFKKAADAFSQAADQFYKEQGNGTVTRAFDDFNKALSEANGKCGALKSATSTFTNAANTFQTTTETFKSTAYTIQDLIEKVLKPSRVQSAISQFKLSAAKFANAATLFNTAADTFGSNSGSAAKALETFATALESATCKQIKQNADKFKEKADLFYTQTTQFQCAVTSFANEAEKFHDLAQQVQASDQNDLNTIKQQFKDAADAFGKVTPPDEEAAPDKDGAAKKLYEAAEKFGRESDGVAKSFFDAVCVLVTGNARTPSS